MFALPLRLISVIASVQYLHWNQPDVAEELLQSSPMITRWVQTPVAERADRELVNLVETYLKERAKCPLFFILTFS